MDYLLVFLLIFDSGYKELTAHKGGVVFESEHECRQYATHHSREYILEHFSNQGIRQVLPGCLTKTRAVSLRLLNAGGI